MYLIITFLTLALTYYLIFKSSQWKYRKFSSPGVCFPLIGHSYRLMNKSASSDVTNSMWELYRKYQRNGMMHINTFTINSIWIGDFQTLKYVLSHSEAQGRLRELIKKRAVAVRFDINRKRK